jgi:DNA-binding PadR family transcriptional regulator
MLARILNMDQTFVDNLIQELRRGLVSLAVLNLLREEQYGYNVLKQLADIGLEVDQGTLYPLLRRLEAQNLLESRWRLEGSRPRRYYVTSQEGLAALPRLREEWNRMVALMQPVVSNGTPKEQRT